MAGFNRHNGPAFGRPRLSQSRRAPRGGGWTLWAAKMALWALFLQILLPLGQGIALPTANDGTPRTLVICSANGGLRTVTLPAGKDDPARDPTQSVQRDCPICLSYAAGNHLAVPDLAPLPHPLAAAARLLGGTVTAPRAYDRTSHPQARAPPQTVS